MRRTAAAADAGRNETSDNRKRIANPIPFDVQLAYSSGLGA